MVYGIRIDNISYYIGDNKNVVKYPQLATILKSIRSGTPKSNTNLMIHISTG